MSDVGAPGGQVLAYQVYLKETFFYKALYLFYDYVRVNAAELPSYKGNCTVGAIVVAPFGNLDISAAWESEKNIPLHKAVWRWRCWATE